jgi:hypothetical protein
MTWHLGRVFGNRRNASDNGATRTPERSSAHLGHNIVVLPPLVPAEPNPRSQPIQTNTNQDDAARHDARMVQLQALAENLSSLSHEEYTQLSRSAHYSRQARRVQVVIPPHTLIAMIEQDQARSRQQRENSDSRDGIQVQINAATRPPTVQITQEASSRRHTYQSTEQTTGRPRGGQSASTSTSNRPSTV